MYLALRVADRLARHWPRAAARPSSPWRPGITVIIPERDAPELLGDALASLHAALARIDEPWQVIVVVNGAPLARYEELAAKHPEVEWIQADAPIGFAGAIERGLACARHDGTFLLNNDMCLAPDALVLLLRLRAPDVFAIGAQIFQRSADGRREETGFVDWYTNRSGIHLYHADVAPDATPGPHLCCSGGASLFRTAPLRRYLIASRCYDPFYWEDAEWGVRAWRDGLQSVFCPAAHAQHRHRATTARFYAPEELARIVERNRWLFAARLGIVRDEAATLMERLCELPYQSQRDLSRWAQAMGVLRQRAQSQRAPQPLAPPALANAADGIVKQAYSYGMRGADLQQAARPRLLMVTPFAIYPPRHGGARRVAALVTELSAEYDIVLVSDEASLYDARSFASFNQLFALHLVERPPAAASGSAAPLPERMRTHAHEALRVTVAAAIQRYRPAVVQIEYAELAGLVEARDDSARWVLGLHDAYGADDFGNPAEGAAFLAMLRAFDAVTVCSSEDAALIAHPRVVCVPNGASPPSLPYTPSVSTQLLFIGPFRYAPNRNGITQFLRTAWPAIRRAVPEVSLLVLGGDESTAIVANDPVFAQPGVQVLGHRDDVPALLAQSALTVNPLHGIRGSAVKLVESLAAGRICVSTCEGARGFAGDAPPALVRATTVAAMAEPIIGLLVDAEARHRQESPHATRWDRFRWSHGAAVQRSLYEDLQRP
jgi:GT2 family glycosyltransferase